MRYEGTVNPANLIAASILALPTRGSPSPGPSPRPSCLDDWACKATWQVTRSVWFAEGSNVFLIMLTKMLIQQQLHLLQHNAAASHLL